MQFEVLKKVFVVFMIGLAAFMLHYAITYDESVGYVENNQNGLRFKIFKSGELVLKAELADTEARRVRGLSGRKSLSKGQGMLFVFDSIDRHGIWMKDMTFPIDIVWIGANYQIVGIAEDVSPKSYPKVYKPEVPALFVLEMNAGLAKEYGLKAGDATFFEL
jgi:uncharacterized membrane protein (UPF0127 family)